MPVEWPVNLSGFQEPADLLLEILVPLFQRFPRVSRAYDQVLVTGCGILFKTIPVEECSGLVNIEPTSGSQDRDVDTCKILVCELDPLPVIIPGLMFQELAVESNLCSGQLICR
nr:hypothetical protein [Methanobacterium formicicum]